jgi:pimeloyl-ACP methyl ester carboxylesterase
MLFPNEASASTRNSMALCLVHLGLGLIRLPPQAPRHLPVVAKAAPPTTLQFDRRTPSDDSLPLLLFLPGIDGTGGAGATQWPRLSDLFEVHSMSLSTDDRSSFDECVDACVSFLDARPSRSALLVGESTGAVLALGVALRAPPTCAGLCLLNPATSYTSTALSAFAPLLPLLPRQLYDATPALVAPLFGKANWFRTIVRTPPPTPTPLLPLPSDILAASAALAEILPPGALAHRLSAHLQDGSAAVNARLAAPSAAAALQTTRTLLLGGERDVVLPSVAETARLETLLPHATRKLLPTAAHACLDDTR